ncbi:serine protease [[Phormidium] sp. ETS-05]|uniref:trypsin-like serine peptidase n=1 Tax=[Phormidium] sp. ETS-05 TaxID=222819 RepID=UPI0018EF1EC9|nr:trypsin-like peptidase domain-containing protein [[Phormidium] sp. ETS-05]
MNKKLMAVFFASLLGVLLISNLSLVNAQSPTLKIAQMPMTVTPESSQAAVGSRPYIPPNLPQSENPFDPGDRAIIGEDNRIEVRSRRYPWTTIGRLESVDKDGDINAFCTGSLIEEDLVLTNAHCLIDKSTHRPTEHQIRFKPNLINGRSQDTALVTAYEYGTNFADDKNADDWALLKIDQPLGRKYGFLGWKTLDFSSSQLISAVSEKLNLAGYSGDFPKDNPGETAGLHQKCSVVDLSDDGSLLHNCDTTGGASGSPIFGLFDDDNYYILALHAGSVTYSDGRVINYAMQVSRWAPQAKEMSQRRFSE